MKLYRPRGSSDVFVGEDREGALMVFPAKPRGWAKRSAFQGKRGTLEEVLASQGRGTGWPGAIGGKPRAASGEPSLYQISVRITAEERDLWRAAAGDDALANWMRTTLTAAARAHGKGK
jgi:hypothetical protein